MLSFLVQAICVAVAAALAMAHVVSNQKVSDTSKFSSGNKKKSTENDNYLDLLPIALLAFEAAGQVCLSRVLSFSDLPTIAISTLYHDQVADSLYLTRDFKLARKGSPVNVSEQDGKKRKTKGWFRRLMLVNGGRQKRQVYRTVCIVCLVLGATTGAQFVRFGAWAALWCAVGVKVGVLVAVACWAGED
ncbi:hypothetical protein LTR70_004589 [Exophiala xenobiotica]|uniref:Uncharacterized protein n=1 Tax=Lithohypha guttulata TaxID=1690604 RepID=A0ABR0KCU8_9EURO|nr:hypothetical protein LTR24_004154 [Lithohypha guttulata]KAK5320363.1 hypothetical protein LTR70_004589 [Exophiala xenobiotica]